MEKFLYGAAVQGIQEFIFQTNELKDIIGASELVRKICTDLFKNTVANYSEDNKVMAAAGNIKYIFDRKEDCKNVAREFPKAVMEAAPGITFSQAVVKYRYDENSKKYFMCYGKDENWKEVEWKDLVEKLEERLRTQRNKPMRSTMLGNIGILRSRTTGLPVVKEEKGEYLDAATVRKREEKPKGRLCEDAFGIDVKAQHFAFDVGDMCDENNWLAIIHADGNGLGKIVQAIGRDKERFKRFSIGLDEATKNAAQTTFGDTILNKTWKGGVILVRPIVVGGDDFTVICRGSLAMEFVASYLDHFEKETEAMLNDIGVAEYQKLTACAGIAFIKKNYPFYYGYGLAEALCEEAKRDAKNGLGDGEVAPSCLMFHKVQDSFVTDYADIVRRELTPADGWSYKYGPYYLHEKEGKMTIEELLKYPEKLRSKEGNALKSGLRKWMSCLSADGEEAAMQRKERMEQILSGNDGMRKILSELLKEGAKSTPVYDVLALCSIINKETNKPSEQ